MAAGCDVECSADRGAGLRIVGWTAAYCVGAAAERGEKDAGEEAEDAHDCIVGDGPEDQMLVSRLQVATGAGLASLLEIHLDM